MKIKKKIEGKNNYLIEWSNLAQCFLQNEKKFKSMRIKLEKTTNLD
jgi:hypothetical protein